MKVREQGALFALAAILLLALALRLINLDQRPLWYDEAFSVLYAEKPFATMLAGTVTEVEGAAADVHPLFFYSLLHGWMALFGQSPAAVRALSVLLGMATVLMSYLLGRRLFDQRTGLVVAVITAVAPFHVYYSQEARMYALLGLAAVTATYFFVGAWSEGGAGNWVGFAMAGAITLYAHNLGIFFLAALDLWVLWNWLRGEWAVHWRPLLLSHLLLLLLFAPWLAILPGQMGKVGQAYWVTRPGIAELLQTLFVFHFAYDNQAVPPWLLPPILLLSLLIPVLLLMELARKQAPVVSDFSGSTSFLVFLSVGPVLLAFLVSQLRPVYVIRATLPAALIYYLLVARLLLSAKMPRFLRGTVFAVALLLVAASLVNHYGYEQFPRAPFPEVDTYLQREAATGDAIVHSNKLSFLPAVYYAPELAQDFIADEPGSASDSLAYPTQQALGLFATADLTAATAGHERVWFLIFRQAVEEYEGAGQSHPHLTWLEEQYRLEDRRAFADLLLYTFER